MCVCDLVAQHHPFAETRRHIYEQHKTKMSIDKKELTFRGLADASFRRDIEWMGHPPDNRDLLFNTVELAGEVGEVCNAVKKLSRTRLGIVGGKSEAESIEHLREELADVVICAGRVAGVLGINLGDAVVIKFNRTSEKNGLETRLEV